MWLSGEYMTANGHRRLNVPQTADHKMQSHTLLKLSARYSGEPDGLFAVWMIPGR